MLVIGRGLKLEWSGKKTQFPVLAESTGNYLQNGKLTLLKRN
jgi:hypothetical protein